MKLDSRPATRGLHRLLSACINNWARNAPHDDLAERIIQGLRDHSYEVTGPNPASPIWHIKQCRWYIDMGTRSRLFMTWAEAVTFLRDETNRPLLRGISDKARDDPELVVKSIALLGDMRPLWQAQLRLGPVPEAKLIERFSSVGAVRRALDRELREKIPGLGPKGVLFLRQLLGARGRK